MSKKTLGRSFGTMIGDLFRSLFRRSFTRQYPAERTAPPPTLRGKLHWEGDKCTGCCLCSKDCPANAIEIIRVEAAGQDKKAPKRFIALYHLDRCTFCAQCVQSCPRHALCLSSDEWELAAVDRRVFTIYYGEDADVRWYLERGASANPDPTAGSEQPPGGG